MVMNILRLVRYKNLIAIAAGQLLVYYALIVPMLQMYGVNVMLPTWAVWTIAGATVLIAAGGYAVNDYFDIKIDRINRPDEVIAGEVIEKRTVMRLYQTLTAAGALAGVATAVVLKSMTLGLIFVIVPGMLWFCSASYKRQLLIGNVIAAVAYALVPMMPLVAESGLLQHEYGELIQRTPVLVTLYTWVCGYAVFTLLWAFIAEVLKDLRDVDGDREMECHTLPVVMGEMKARTAVSVMTAVTLGLMCWVVFGLMNEAVAVRYFIVGIVLPAACSMYFVWRGACTGYKNATGFIYFIMMAGYLYTVVNYYQVAKACGLTFFGLFNIA